MRPPATNRFITRLVFTLLAALTIQLAFTTSASAQICGHSGLPCCPDVYLGSIDDCCAEEFGICIPFSCAYATCTCDSGHTNIAGLCVPCGSEWAPACTGQCCEWFWTVCIDPCPCDDGLVAVGGICIDPENPVNCALNPCQTGCSPECNPLCDDVFDPCNCPQYEEFCCGLDPCNEKCSPECTFGCDAFNVCDCFGIGCGCAAAGSCCSANGTPGCSDPTCCTTVCATKPHCCDPSGAGWNQECAEFAATICPSCNPCLQNPCNAGCGGECVPGLPCYNPCACGPCHPDCFDACACFGESPCNPDCDIFDPCACVDLECPCGSDGEIPCPCDTPPFLCCDDGYGIDPINPLACTKCYPGNPPFMCNHDGLGQIGEPGWDPLSIEYLRTFFRRCDTGLIWDPATETCVNALRHRPDVAQFKNSWNSTALRLQRGLNDQLPVTQGQRLAAHNSYNNSVDLAPLYQHSYSLSDQLDMGVRSIELDAHWSHTDWPDFGLKDVRLAHAQNDHRGMMPTDRPYRHAVEELANWVSQNPGELVFIHIEMRTDNTLGGLGGTNESTHLIPPIEDYLAPYLFRPSHFQQLGGDWTTISPKNILDLGKRVVVLGGGQGVDSLPPSQNAITIPPSSLPAWSEGGANGVNEFLNYYQYSQGDTNSMTADPSIFTSFTGDPSAFSCEFALDVCVAVLCSSIQCDIPGFTHPACDACIEQCNEWCEQPLFDGPNTFGITTPTVVREMIRAGVNEIGLCPIGTSVAGITGGYEPVTMPFQPLMEAAVWSWAPGHPIVLTPLPQFTRGAFAQIVEVVDGLPRARLVTDLQSGSRRVAALSPDGREWKITQGTANFANAANLVEQEFPGWHFAVPGSGLQMQRLADALLNGGGAAWVNYSAPAMGLNWTGNVIAESPRPEPAPEDLNGDGSVNVQDLLLLLAAWGPCPDVNDCPADIDASGDVGVSDLLALLAAWGT